MNETFLNISELTSGEQYTFTVIAVAGDQEALGEAKTVLLYTSKMCSNSLSGRTIIRVFYRQIRFPR